MVLRRADTSAGRPHRFLAAMPSGQESARRRLCVAVLALVVATCSRAWATSLAQELKIGERASREVESEMPPSKNQKWQDEIAALGAKLVPYVNRKEIPYHFKILTDKNNSVNAFALPGGYVYFTEHMWRILTRDERAAVMAHEIVHCDMRHGINEASKQTQQLLWTLPLIVLTGGAAGELMWIGNVAIAARYSRKMEREADEKGIALLHKAGFNPAGAVTSMKKLLSIENDENRYEISALWASHPDTEKRVDYLTKAALAMGAKPSELELPSVDDPARLGNIIRKTRDVSTLYCRTTVPLDFGQKVLIKKQLWDEDQGKLAPQTIAEATVLTPGKFPILVLTAGKSDQSFCDVMVGDGIYPAP